MKEKRNWVFDEPKDVAVFSTVSIMKDGAPILKVTHDEDDGAWQFLDGFSTNSSKNALVVSLSEIVELDASVIELANLPIGWEAIRTSKDASWFRQKKATIEEKLDRVTFINRIYNLLGVIQGISLGLAIIILISFLPVFPAGYIEGKTSIMQILFVYLNPKLFFICAICLLIIFALSLGVKRYLKKKHSRFIF